MLNIDRSEIIKFNLDMLKKHRGAMRLIALILFIVGVLCIFFPFVSGAILSVVVGILLICAGIVLFIGLFKNRVHNFWPVLSGTLISVAYLFIGYFFIRTPLLGVSAISGLISGLFFIGGFIRLVSWYHMRHVQGSWLQVIIGVLDIIIAWLFIEATPITSVTMVSTLVGIELIFSAVSLFSISRLFSK